MMASRAERYLAHLDRLSGGLEPRFHQIPSTHPGQKAVTVVVYRDLPENGFITGLTYGLSLAEHPEWRVGKPELMISVRSADISWALAIGTFAEEWRGEQPFIYGSTMNHGEPVCAESQMSAFVVFAPAVLDKTDYLDIDVGDEKRINISGCYPIYESERKFIHQNGLEAFWKLDWDPFDVQRPPAV
jgi:hypothetical protein